MVSRPRHNLTTMPSRNNGETGSPEWLPVSRMFIDLTYGRAVDPYRVRRIVQAFEPDAIGALIVSDRGTDDQHRYAILDGGHRAAAMCDDQIGWADQQVPCVVHRNLTIEQEAALFVRFNRDRRAPDTLTIYRAEVAAADTIALAINDTLTRHGLKAARGAHPGYVQGINRCAAIVRRAGIEVLDGALTLIVTAWPSREAVALNAVVIEGAAILVAQNPDRDLHAAALRIGRNLSQFEIAADARAASKLRHEATGSGTAFAAARILANAANKRVSPDNQLRHDWAAWPRRAGAQA